MKKINESCLKPALSVITPTYNCAQFILRSYALLKNQSFSDWEWVVVNDGSTDNTSEILSAISFHDSRIKVYNLNSNQGRGYARTEAIKKSQSDVIVIWDIDDIYVSDRLEEINNALVIGLYDYYYSDALIIDMNFCIIGASEGNAILGLKSPAFRHPALAFKKYILRDCEYNIKMAAGEDLHVLITLQTKYNGFRSDGYKLLYVQDREINLYKTLKMNYAHLSTYTKIFIFNSQIYYGKLILKYTLRQAVLLLLLLTPNVYIFSVKFRKTENAKLSKINDLVMKSVRLAQTMREP